MWGRATASIAAAVIAASMASPPFRSTCRPASAARGWPAVTAASVPRASRPGSTSRDRGEEQAAAFTTTPATMAPSTAAAGRRGR